MISVILNEQIDDVVDCKVFLKGSPEEIAQEYVALTLKLHDSYPVILDRAKWYLDDILELRRTIND